MGFALRKKDSGDEPSDGVSVKDRLRAWWNGDELDAKPNKNSVGSRGESDLALEEDVETWSETRQKLAQEIWSHGFVVPGGTEYIEKLVSGCSLTEAETMLEIGVGMGGGTRTIIGKFGNYVTGYERDENLAAAAMDHAITYEIDDKLEITSLPFEELKLKPKYFRAALVRDILYTMEDKAGLIAKISGSLKSGESSLVMTDFLFDAEDESEELLAWKAVEERRVYPWDEQSLTKALEAAGVQPRIVNEEGDEYCAMVVEAWSDYLKTIDEAEVTPELGREMEREGEYWARRVAAIKSGALHYYRIEGVKSS